MSTQLWVYGKYGLSPQEFPRALLSGPSLDSGHILPYPGLFLIRIQLSPLPHTTVGPSVEIFRTREAIHNMSLGQRGPDRRVSHLPALILRLQTQVQCTQKFGQLERGWFWSNAMHYDVLTVYSTHYSIYYIF